MTQRKEAASKEYGARILNRARKIIARCTRTLIFDPLPYGERGRTRQGEGKSARALDHFIKTIRVSFS